MSQCIGITKKGTQCLRNRSGIASQILCTTHIKHKPEKVILEGVPDKQVDFIDEASYYALLDKINRDNEDRARIEKIAKEATYRSILTCTVCSDIMNSREELISCSSSCPEYVHLVCSGCLKGHITSLLNDGIASLECMFNKHDHCGGLYTESDIKQALLNDVDSASSGDIGAIGAIGDVVGAASADISGEDIMAKWRDVMTSTEIIQLASICENYLICPLCCRWGCIFERPVGAGAEKLGFGITCGACQKQWCTLCKRGWHPERTCYEIAFTERELADEALRILVIDKMIQDIATRSLMHCCSICGCEYIKEEGCNLMTCPKCNGMSCYICGMKIYYKGDTKYWHFTGHDKSDRDATCPLWNNKAGDGKPNQGNNEFNMKIMANEIVSFISANNQKQNIGDLIYSRVAKHFEKEREFINIIQQMARTRTK